MCNLEPYHIKALLAGIIMSIKQDIVYGTAYKYNLLSVNKRVSAAGVVRY